MQLVLAALIFLGGFFLPVQVALNSRLSTGLGSPVRSSIVSFVVGLLALAVVLLLADGPISSLTGIGRPAGLAERTIPAWAFLGGICGAFYVLISMIALPRLGALATIALALLGQQSASLVIDTFGLFAQRSCR